MANLIKMPAIVADATEAVLSAWHAEPGSTVAVGEAIADIETEKAVVELEAESAGVLARLLVDPGTSVEVGAPIAVITGPGEGDDEIAAALASAGLATPSDAPAPKGTGGSGDRVFISPLARRVARERGLDLALLTGSGPSGRILRSDVETAAAARPTPAGEDSVAAVSAASRTQPAATPPIAPTVSAAQPAVSNVDVAPLTRMRQAIARRLTESKSTVPHFYLAVDVRMDDLLAFRKELNAAATRKITVNDLVVRAIALALREVPDANVGFNGDSMFRYRHSDISVAIATDGGLVTPVVRRAESLSISEVSAVIGGFAERAQAGRIRPDELVGGSFTVSNLGMFGTKEFSAILNPPQAGILAVGAATPRAVVTNGELGAATVMTCTLSADHRVVDGAVAAQLMEAFKRRMENPLSILL
jgi:pyruvate dehydrogenase E2 component (dihydrolipoamide acetyltransferase)